MRRLLTALAHETVLLVSAVVLAGTLLMFTLAVQACGRSW